MVNTQVQYLSIDDAGAYNGEYGAVYSCDDARYVYDPDLGKGYDITGTSMNFHQVIAQAEYS